MHQQELWCQNEKKNWRDFFTSKLRVFAVSTKSKIFCFVKELKSKTAKHCNLTFFFLFLSPVFLRCLSVIHFQAIKASILGGSAKRFLEKSPQYSRLDFLNSLDFSLMYVKKLSQALLCKIWTLSISLRSCSIPTTKKKNSVSVDDSEIKAIQYWSRQLGRGMNEQGMHTQCKWYK